MKGKIMSVLKSKRKTSTKFDVQINARKLRLELTDSLMNDTDMEKISNSNDATQMRYVKNIICDLLRRLTNNIAMANSIYVSNMVEYEERRKFQDYAIGNCCQIEDELYYLVYIFKKREIKVNANKYINSINLLNKEKQLLSAWRKSENKFKNKYANMKNDNENNNVKE